MDKKISKTVYDSVRENLIFENCENGGIIGKNNKDVISNFYLDTPDVLFSDKYEPNISKLNSVIEEWAKNDIEFCGMIHSHPENHPKLSRGDILYAEKILDCNDVLSELYFGITQYQNNNFFIIMYLFTKSQNHGKITFEKVDLKQI